MIKILENLEIVNEMTLKAALDSITQQITGYLSNNNINHNMHSINVFPDYADKCVKIQFKDTNMEYIVKPAKDLSNRTVSHSTVYKSIKRHFPNAIYNPIDNCFYDGNNKIGTAHVALPVSKTMIILII